MLTNAFQTGYNQGDLIQFTISGISNPSTVEAQNLLLSKYIT